MAFIERISADLTAAMRSKDQVKLGTLRMAKAALMNREVERGRALDDAESQQVIASLIKQRRDSFEQFHAAGRTDLAEKEQAEITVLEAYLPPPMATAELERLVDEAVVETGVESLVLAEPGVRPRFLPELHDFRRVGINIGHRSSFVSHFGRPPCRARRRLPRSWLGRPVSEW